MKKVLGFDADVLGASASFLCAIHCALVPLIITFGLLGGASFLANPLYDVLFIGASMILAFIALVNGYKNHHQRWYPIITAFIGFGLIFLGHLVFHNLVGDAMSVLGGISIAVAHLLNYRACRTCLKCRH
jgi:hypothetical protein